MKLNVDINTTVIKSCPVMYWIYQQTFDGPVFSAWYHYGFTGMLFRIFRTLVVHIQSVKSEMGAKQVYLLIILNPKPSLTSPADMLSV